MQSKKTIWEFFLDNYKFTFLILIGLILFGIVSAISLPKESDPEVKIPIAVVQTVFVGASVEEVEELITNPIEDALTGISDVESIDSVSSRGVSSITVEFNVNADPQEVVNDVQKKVDLVKVDLPEDASDPIVQEVSLSDQAFLIMALSGPYSEAELTDYAKGLESEIERISGVSEVNVIGAKEREFRVVVQRDKLDQAGLEITQVTQAIQNANSDVPIGSIETGGEEFGLRFAGRLENKEHIERTPISAVNGVPIFVGDVAEVIDTFAQAKSLSSLSVQGQEPFAAVSLAVKKSVGGDIVRMSDEIFELIEEQKGTVFPEDVEVKSVQNTAEYIRDDLGNLTKNGVATVIIVGILLILFIGYKEAVMGAIAIPLAFLMTFIGLFALGMTINFITLFALILSLGILVDSAIVINEGLSKNMASGKTPRQAAIETIREFQYPLISGTLTTVFAFVPMLLTGGIVGEYIKTIPITVSLVLISSLFVALAIVPVLSVWFENKTRKKRQAAGETQLFVKKAIFADAFVGIKKSYHKNIREYLESKKKRKTLARWIVVLFFASFLLPVVGLLKVELFPSDDIDFFGIDVENPIGTPLVQTQQSMEGIVQELLDDERIDYFQVEVGSTLNFSGNGGARGNHLGNVLITLVDKSERDQKSTEIIEEYRDTFANYADAEVSISQPGSGPPGAAPVEVRIEGNDLDELDRLSEEFVTLLEDIDGTVQVKTAIEQSNGQFVFKINRTRAQQFGINTAGLAFVLRNAITGAEATQITYQGGDDIPVVVHYALGNTQYNEKGFVQTTLQDIEALTISTPSGDVPVSNFVDIELEQARQQIIHKNGLRTMAVRADVTEDTTPYEVFEQVRSRMNQEIDIPNDVTITLGGENEETAESFADMLRAMGLAIIMIGALLVLQFHSFRQSTLILVTIPLALIGVFPGLYLMNQPISFPGVIGIVALAGIVVNNAIILIDRININRKGGMSLNDAIADAGESRMEPIILTTITTVFGILPLAITQAVWASLGYAIIFGLMFSTITTLFVIPILYRFLYHKEENKQVLDEHGLHW